jgi:hypothetical protein
MAADFGWEAVAFVQFSSSAHGWAAYHIAAEVNLTTPVYAHNEESLAIFRELEDKWSMRFSLLSLGRLACLQEDDASARSLFEEGLAIRRELADKVGFVPHDAHQRQPPGRQGDLEKRSQPM